MLKLKEQYLAYTRELLSEQFFYEHNMQIPKISSIVVHVSLKDLNYNKEQAIYSVLALELITGQAAITTIAKKAVVNLQIRQGMVVGAMVTLRNEVMYSFLDHLITVALPRLKFFSGVLIDGSNRKTRKIKHTDTLANYNSTFIINDPLCFVELESEYLKFHKVPPLMITINSTARTAEEHTALLTFLRFPFIS